MNKHFNKPGNDPHRRGDQAPNPMKSDVGRTDDVPNENARSRDRDDLNMDHEA